MFLVMCLFNEATSQVYSIEITLTHTLRLCNPTPHGLECWGGPRGTNNTKGCRPRSYSLWGEDAKMAGELCICVPPRFSNLSRSLNKLGKLQLYTISQTMALISPKYLNITTNKPYANLSNSCVACMRSTVPPELALFCISNPFIPL